MVGGEASSGNKEGNVGDVIGGDQSGRETRRRENNSER